MDIGDPIIAVTVSGDGVAYPSNTAVFLQGDLVLVCAVLRFWDRKSRGRADHGVDRPEGPAHGAAAYLTLVSSNCYRNPYEQKSVRALAMTHSEKNQAVKGHSRTSRNT